MQQSYSLRVEVDQHGQVAVDHPLCEVLRVLDVEGDVSPRDERARQSLAGRQEGLPGRAGLQRGGEPRAAAGGCWEAEDILHRQPPHPTSQQPVSHL